MNKKLIKTIASITCSLGIVVSIPMVSTSCNDHSWLPNAIPKEYLNISDGILHGFKDTFIPSEHINDGYDTLLVPKDVTSIKDKAFDDDQGAPCCLPWYIENIKFENNSKIESIGDFAFSFNECPATPKLIDLPEGLKTLGIMYSYFKGTTKIIFPSSLETCENFQIDDGSTERIGDPGPWISHIVLRSIDIENLSSNSKWLNNIYFSIFSDAVVKYGIISVTPDSKSSSNEVLTYLKNKTKSVSGVSPFNDWIAI